MAEDLIGSANAGSPNNFSDPAVAGESAAVVSTEEMIPKSQYDELESKIGEQGNELGQYREFYSQISPILDKLDAQPELVKAIMDDKIDASLAKAVLDGKVSIKEAETVTKAHVEVKKDLGTQQYNAISPEEIERLVDKKVAEITKPITDRVDSKLDDAEKLRTYENSINEFINSTPDFPEYADKISKWFIANPDQDDIRIAYDVIKGRAIQEQFAKTQTKAEAEAAKEMALNAGGGMGMGSGTISDKNTIDNLISDISNPNSF